MKKKFLYTQPLCEIIEVDTHKSLMELVLSVYDEESEIIGANDNSIFNEDEGENKPSQSDLFECVK